MKNILIYALLFIIAFVGVTAGIYYYNQKYMNMFEFDFRETAVVEAQIADSLAQLHADSLAAADSLHAPDQHAVAENKEEHKKELKTTKKELTEAEHELDQKEKEIKRLKDKLESEKTAEHEEWLSATVKLYEEMESLKAADILSKIPEGEAREIIYKMKKKKAADILSQLNAETVQRLTRAN